MPGTKAAKNKAGSRTAGRSTNKTSASRDAQRPRSAATGARKVGARARTKASEIGATHPLSGLMTETELAETKHALKTQARKKGQVAAKAKSTRVANPKRSTVEQASKRAAARGVDGRLAR